MKKSIFLTAAFAALAIGSASAQDLDTVSIADQFDVGAHGNETGTGGSFGAVLTDGTEFSDYSGVDAFGIIRYINTYAGASSGDSGGESPIVDVTAVGVANFDRSSPAIPIPANTLSGASDGSKVITISDDGGTNNLFFGESNNGNYFIEVDMYVQDASASGGSELGYVAVRAGRDAADEADNSVNTGPYTIDREGSYYIAVNYKTLTVNARQSLSNSGALIAGTDYIELTAPVAITTGWHRFRIDANGGDVDFLVDGTSIGSITGATILTGRAAIGHREASVAAGSEIASVFDNLKAGQAIVTPSSVDNWSLYQN